jgi:putative transcriptional regulator
MGKREWLISIRNELNMSQQEAADKAGISRSAYAGYETGRRDPEIDNAISVANALGFEWTLFFAKKCRTKTQDKKTA